jgi:cytochrome c-type biogenesis protein CcmH/NrfG
VRGRSYLINRAGFRYQSPISWYTERQAWDLSPHLGKAIQQLYRPVTVQCLFCHCNSFEADENAGNKYLLPRTGEHSIGCERCHGPGELHVRNGHASEKNDDGSDATIVNPARLEPALRDGVCEQCHLQGVRVVRRAQRLIDFRPGLPLSHYLSVFMPTHEGNQQNKFAGQVEQMHASACFKGSNGKLGCISCHDPHRKPSAGQKLSFFRDRCLVCHQTESCGLPKSERSSRVANDDCVACHMPRIPNTNIAHTSSTDHRILRRATSADGPKNEADSDNQALSAFAYFFQQSSEVSGKEIARDLGVGMMDLAALKQPERNRSWLAGSALPALESAIQSWPDDEAAWQANGYALWLLRRYAEAMTAFEKALELAPKRVETLVYAAGLATQLGKDDDAAGYWRRALDVNPYSVRSHLELARLLARRNDWQPCLSECQAALHLDPFEDQARKLLISALVHLRKNDRAASELDKVLRLNPKESAGIKAWFKHEMESTKP